MKSLLIALLFGSVLLFIACNDDDPVDVTAPTITMEEPVYGEMIAAGEVIHFDALFEDDVQLATYNIDIHNNFDGHGHARIAVAPFDYEASFPLTGLIDDVHEDIEVPSDATAGPYHLTVEAIDAAGNSTTFVDGSSKEVEIWITNEEMPHVHFEDMNGIEVSEYEGTVDVALKFYGEIEDQVGMLDHVEIIVGHLEEVEEHDHSHGRVLEGDIYEGDFEVGGETSVRIETLLADATITVSQADLDELEEGEHLYLIVVAEDEDGNISRHAIEIHFD